MKSIIKKLIPANAHQSVKRSFDSIERHMAPLFANNALLASFYYFAFSRRFDREHLAVLKGRIAYHSDNGSILLRRNTHRLEKGLIMRPRRTVYGKDYIGETVECYLRVQQQSNPCAQEQAWSHDVLCSYFDAVDKTDPLIATALAKFETARSFEHQGATPYPRSELARSEINYDAFKTLCRQRRSVRWYQQKPVALELIHKAAALATQAPSACNRQPFRFHTLLNPDDAVKIAKTAIGTTGFADNIPAMIVVVGDLSAYYNERDRHVIYIDASLASMQLMLALETLGLSSCPINWPDVEIIEKRMARMLKLKAHERPVLLIAVGHADDEGMIPYSQKKTPEQVVKEVQL